MDAQEMYQKVKDGDDSGSNIALKMAVTELVLNVNAILTKAMPAILAEFENNLKCR